MDPCQENIITPFDPCFKDVNMGFKNLPKDSRRAIKFIVDTLMCSVYPLLKRIGDQLHHQNKNEISDENCLQIRNVYTLCADQIKKCILTLFDIIKIEYQQGVFLQESRQCTVERICWCIQKLASIEHLLEKPSRDMLDASLEFVTFSSMYFVNWVDQTFDILGKLSSVISRNDFKKTDELSTDWKKELIECVCGLHTSVDELLLSAMTLCKHCLPADQYVVKARCQVVLRETKTLLNELIKGDLDTVQATIETLKLPIMPFNINVRIDVLKDVLYVLETNTNTALLALVVHCFSQDVSPVEKLKSHFENSSKTCTCVETGDDTDVAEKCKVIKDFDLYNERLLQIGSFAMSCSSDQKRILNLRSGLASLEALDPHLVPAVMLSPRSPHAGILSTTWREETILIMNSVFLIVDPAAFADKARQMMHQNLLELVNEEHYDNIKTCSVINIGCVVCEFFEVYEKWEPDALTCHEQLAPLLRDLNKVQIECKIVSNLLCSSNEHKYDVKVTRKTTNPTIQQLVKRLKLLYTLVKRINLLYNPRENDDEFYEEPLENKNFTQTYNKYATYVNSPKKHTHNFSKSVFARTNMRCSTGKFPLAILTKHMKARNNRDLSFSIKLDGLCDVSELKLNREPSILYHTPLKSKTSLRKVVLCKQRALPYEKRDFNDKTELESNFSEKESVLDDAMSLQITDVLNQINDLTFNVSTTTERALNSTVVIEKPAKNNEDLTKNVLKLSINNDATFKRNWNISVSSSVAGSEITSNITQPSEVNTLERIKDLELVESRLSDLKSGHIETSL